MLELNLDYFQDSFIPSLFPRTLGLHFFFSLTLLILISHYIRFPSLLIDQLKYTLFSLVFHFENKRKKKTFSPLVGK